MSAATPILSIVKASFDYEPQSDDELGIKEGQLLFLLDESDKEYATLSATSHLDTILTWCTAGGK
jgi:hypothetical protein